MEHEMTPVSVFFSAQIPIADFQRPLCQQLQYQLYMKSGVPKSTIGNIVNCSYDSVKLRIIHELCQGLGIGIDTFFASPLFQEDNLEP